MNTLITFGFFFCILVLVVLVGFIIGKERREKLLCFAICNVTYKIRCMTHAFCGTIITVRNYIMWR